MKKEDPWKLRTQHIFPNRCEEWLLCINDCWKIILCKTRLNKQLHPPLYSFPKSRTTMTHHIDAGIIFLLVNKHRLEKKPTTVSPIISIPSKMENKILREKSY